MAETGARVFIVEDNEEFVFGLKMLLTCWGHTPVGEVYWAATAMNCIQTLMEKRVQILTLDRDLFGGDVIARGFVNLVRRECPNVVIVGLAGLPIEGVHYNLGRENVCQLDEVIRRFVQ